MDKIIDSKYAKWTQMSYLKDGTPFFNSRCPVVLMIRNLFINFDQNSQASLPFYFKDPSNIFKRDKTSM